MKRHRYPLLRASVRELGLSRRVNDLLVNGRVIFVGQLVRMTPRELRLIPHLGRAAVEEIYAALAKRRLTLGMERPSRWRTSKTPRELSPTQRLIEDIEEVR